VSDRNSILEMAESLWAASWLAVTAKQTGIFRYIVEAMLVIPNATIHTSVTSCSQTAMRGMRPISARSTRSGDFFETRFNSASFTSTKEEIFWRSILS